MKRDNFIKAGVHVFILFLWLIILITVHRIITTSYQDEYTSKISFADGNETNRGRAKFLRDLFKRLSKLPTLPHVSFVDTYTSSFMIIGNDIGSEREFLLITRFLI